MKKLLSLLMAALMLLLPMAGVAENAEAESPLGFVKESDYAVKYLAEGQRLVTDVRIQAGDGLMAMIPEDFQAPVKDLLDALTIQITGQTVDHQAQSTVRLQMNEDSAADFIVAADQSGIYAASSFLGDQILQVTPAQVKPLLNQMLEQAVADGQMTQEQVDAMKKAYRMLRTDPQALITALVGEADPAALITAVYELLNFEATPEEVTEKPENVTIDAAYVMTVPLSKDGLAKVMNELAKFLWSMPGVQKAAPMMKINDQPMTEEALTAALNAFPEMLAEDIIIKVYLTNDFSTIQALSDIRMAANGEEALEKMNIIVEAREDGAHVVSSVNVIAGDQDITIGGDMVVAVSENGGSVTYDITGTTKANGEDFTPIHEAVNMVWTEQENAKTMNMDIAVESRQAPGADAVRVNVAVADEKKDLGDHAEENATVSVAADGMGSLITISAAARTDLAEAYIITPDAVQPLAMNEEEMAAFQNNLMSSLQVGLINLISKLPASVQPIVMQMFQ